jgi:sec-independent protein translocase protein TatC
VLLYQVYAFVLPAFSPSEKRVVLPLLLSVPFLFIAGVVFAYYVVMPAALDFLLGFNSDDFDTQLRAGEYIGFFALTEIAVGLLFQIPVGVIAVLLARWFGTPADGFEDETEVDEGPHAPATG